MLQEHHHLSQNGMQRNARMGMQQMGPPPNQRSQPMLMSIQQPVPAPHTGVLVSMPQGPTLITTTSIPQQAQKPPAGMQQVYHYENGIQSEVIEQQPQHTEVQPQSSPNTNTSSGPGTNLANIKEKTPMCLVNELARYNKIQHQYRLTGEQGPAHKKTFTVTLKLGNEEYEAEGPSIKKAQHSAAAQALLKTEFKHPPPKTTRNSRVGFRTSNQDVMTPTVELNALAMKRGERPVYIIENGTAPAPYLPQPNYYPRHNMYTSPQTRYGFDGRRPVRGHYPSYHDGRYYGQYRAAMAATNPAAAGPQNHDPCTVRLHVGEREYPGVGYSVQAARHDAAAKAIKDIKSMGTEPAEHNTLETITPEAAVPPDLNTELKSPISLVHEIALKRNLNVTFEVLSEKGPPHMKVFVTRCHVGTFVAEGEGNGKKISKKRAAEKMLEELMKLPPLPQMYNNIMKMKRKRMTNKKKTRNLIKMNVDKTTETVEEINPISRLIQIQQANKEREPVYTVLEERGAARRREFVIEASVNGHSCTGVGPNKKVAKRNAAEALLIALGYNSVNSKPSKVDKEVDSEKGRKVTFMEEKPESSQVQVGGSGGRQLVPGLLLVGPQGEQFQQKKDGIQINPETKRNIPPPTTQGGVRSKDQLLYLAQLMNIQVQFSDFPKANHEMYLTLVSLSTNPPQVCHGEGPTTEASHEKAALEALKVLSELGLDIVNPTKDNSESGKGAMNQNAVKK